MLADDAVEAQKTAETKIAEAQSKAEAAKEQAEATKVQLLEIEQTRLEDVKIAEKKAALYGT